jgi:hypothetical protein
MDDLEIALRDPGDTRDLPKDPASRFKDLNALMQRKLKEYIDRREKQEWKLTLRRGEIIRIQDVAERSLNVLAYVKDFVGTVMALNPYGAIAWSAVCLGLLVSITSALLYLISVRQL